MDVKCLEQCAAAVDVKSGFVVALHLGADIGVTNEVPKPSFSKSTSSPPVSMRSSACRRLKPLSITMVAYRGACGAFGQMRNFEHGLGLNRSIRSM